MANSSTLTAAAEAVKDALNGAPDGTFDAAFTAVRAYAPVYTVEALKTLRVTVVPKAIVRDRATRKSDDLTVSIDIAVQKQLTATDDAAPGRIDNAEADALMALVEAIAVYFRAARVPGYAAAASMSIENDPAWSQEHMAEKRCFTSVLTLTLRINQEIE